jgi:hypothetical protein
MTALQRLMWLLVLACSIVKTGATNGAKPPFQHYMDLHSPVFPLRRLQSNLACNEIVASWSSGSLIDLTHAAIDRSAGAQSTESALFKAILTPVIKYGVQVRKLCSSCEAMRMHEDEKHRAYCSSNDYGYNILQTGLLILPTDANGGSILQGTFPGLIYSHGSSVRKVPSLEWYGEDSGLIMFANLAIAASGVAAIMPDYLGYGAYDDAGFWDNAAFKSYLIKKSYPTSIMPLWYKSAELIQQESHCSSALGNAVAIYGYSEGGYVSVAMADTMDRLGIHVVHVDAGGAPIDIETSLYASVRNFDNLEFPLDQRQFLALVGNSHSSTYPDIASYQKQDMLNPTSMPAIKSILFNSTEPLNSGVLNQIYQVVPPDDPLSILIPEVNMVRTYVADGIETSHPCRATAVEGVTDLLCQVFIDNSLVEAVLNARYRIRFCHSPDDKVVTIDNIPANISQYSHLSFIEASGEHQEAGTFCLVQAILYLTGNDLVSVNATAVQSVEVCPEHDSLATPTAATTTAPPSSRPSSILPTVDNTLDNDISMGPATVPPVTRAPGTSATPIPDDRLTPTSNVGTASRAFLIIPVVLVLTLIASY